MDKPPVSLFVDLCKLELDSLASRSQLRRLELHDGIDLSSNDYLGLSADSRLREAVTAALAAGSPVGSTGSRLLSGNAQAWEDLEAELARFSGTEAALYFNSGYAANIGLLGSILTSDDVVFSDQFNHASIIDGIRVSGARKLIFPHLDLDFLEGALRAEDESHNCSGRRGQKLIVVESLFSMEGDRAPVRELVSLARRYGAEIVFDEAHAVGALGPSGRGLVAAAGAESEVLAAVHTCGKALAGVGAFVACSDTLKQYLINRARTFIFSTALPPYIAAQMRAAISIVLAANDERSQLADLGSHLRARLRHAGFNTGRSDSHIVPVMLGENGRAVEVAGALCAQGFLVRAIRPPTVPEGTARLRLSLRSSLSTQTLDRLVDTMTSVREEMARRGERIRSAGR